MKQCQVIVCAVLLLTFACGLQARLFLNTNQGILCVWSTKRSCDKATPVCVEANAMCKYYRNECQYLIDVCLSKTVYGRTGILAPAKCVAQTPGTIAAC